MTRYLAWIEPVTPEQPGSPPGFWGGSSEPFPGYGLPMPRPPGVPAHPIYYPPGIWGPNDPRPGYGLPPGTGIWGGANQPFPGYGLPVPPPGFWGGSGEPFPGWGLPGAPPGTWGGAGEPFPGWGLPPPGFKPPDGLPTVPEGKALVILYVPGDGFKVAVIPKPGTPGNFPPDTQPVKK